jgi:predicted translin family RNA/ssDNA-binding protein
MINKKDFLRLKKELDDFEEQREATISKSRDILKSSKQAVYSVHRHEMKEAGKLITQAEKDIAIIKKNIINNPKLDFVGAYSAAIQEYVEAKCYYEFIRCGCVPSQQQLDVQVEDYLLGLCDLTGELGRKTVLAAIAKDYQMVVTIRNLVDDIHGLFLQLNLRNGELRKKSDSIKWNLKKIEDVLYDVKTKGHFQES